MTRPHATSRTNKPAAVMLAVATLIFLTFCSPQSILSTNTQTNANTTAATPNQPVPGETVFALEPAPVLGVVVNRKMQVVYVEKGGAADKGGLQEGDILKIVNSKSVSQPNAAREAFYSINSSRKSTLIILRGGQEITLEIRPAPPPSRAGQATPTPVPQDMTYF